MFTYAKSKHQNSTIIIFRIVEHGIEGVWKRLLVCVATIKKYNAKHFAIDQVMLKKYGRNPKDFNKAYQECDDYIWQETAKLIQAGQDVIL